MPDAIPRPGVLFVRVRDACRLALRDCVGAVQLASTRDRSKPADWSAAVVIAAQAAIGAGVAVRARRFAIRRRFVRAGGTAVAIAAIRRLDANAIERGTLRLVEFDGTEHVLVGFDAVEAAQLLAPQLLEGRRLRWERGAWALHNVVAHPVMQLAAWLGAPRLGVAIHDASIPRPALRR